MTEKAEPVSGNTEQQLPPEALRALAEAEERRRTNRQEEELKEIRGRGGKNPVRYGDWEIKGRAIDF